MTTSFTLQSEVIQQAQGSGNNIYCKPCVSADYSAVLIRLVCITGVTFITSLLVSCPHCCLAFLYSIHSHMMDITIIKWKCLSQHWVAGVRFHFSRDEGNKNWATRLWQRNLCENRKQKGVFGNILASIPTPTGNLIKSFIAFLPIVHSPTNFLCIVVLCFSLLSSLSQYRKPA